MKMLVCLGILALGSTMVAASGDPYRTLEYWELARSPGGEALASLLSQGEPEVAARAALALGRTGKLLAAALGARGRLLCGWGGRRAHLTHCRH